MIWPIPAEFRYGTKTVCADPKMKVEIVCQENEIWTELQSLERLEPKLTGMPMTCDQVRRAFERFQERVFTQELVDTSKSCLSEMKITVHKGHMRLDAGIDESYTLEINQQVNIVAETSVGAFHALESLSQLVAYDFDQDMYLIENAYWYIKDEPRFAHREVLIDTARHFLSVPTIRSLLISLSYVKVNVLHWHLADDENWPYCSKTMPYLCGNGSFSPLERYSKSDVAGLVKFAADYGIRVVMELDLPGHTSSWCRGYPEICTANKRIISPVRGETFDFIDGLLEELVDLAPDSFFHIGGDEVRTSLWDQDEETRNWMNENNMTSKDVYLNFVRHAQKKLTSLGRRPVGWSEIWDSFGTALDSNVVLHKWRSQDSLKDMTLNKYNVLWSDSESWYLDHLMDNTTKRYLADPCEGLGDDLCKYVSGGGGAMWGEFVDGSVLFNTIYPGLTAIAEKLWSPVSQTGDLENAISRLHRFRCVLLLRGVGVAPVNEESGRSAPPRSGSCSFPYYY